MQWFKGNARPLPQIRFIIGRLKSSETLTRSSKAQSQVQNKSCISSNKIAFNKIL